MFALARVCEEIALECPSTGFDAYAAKPIDPVALVALAKTLVAA